MTMLKFFNIQNRMYCNSIESLGGQLAFSPWNLARLHPKQEDRCTLLPGNPAPNRTARHSRRLA
jgi:hypothetical protein